MNMKAETAKKVLDESIHALDVCKWLYCSNPENDFTRHRKLSFVQTVSAILSFRGGTTNHDLRDFFRFDPTLPTSSAFIQQRAKILPEAFETLFHSFTDSAVEKLADEEFHLLAVDGSDLQIATNPLDPDAYFPGTDGRKSYNLLHINALYDLNRHLYTDAIVQKSRLADECGALTAMVDRSNLSDALVIADRGYESFNNLAHIQEKGWKFLFRIKDGNFGIASGLDLPDKLQFDVPVVLHLTRKQTNEAKMLCRNRNSYRFIPTTTRFDYLPKNSRKHDPVIFYNLPFRIVRFPISESSVETVITNLPADAFPPDEIMRLYALRWGIETSFRDLKHTLALLHLHSKKVEFILQEIFAKLTMYNFCELITQSVVIHQGDRKYAYKVNFSDTAHVCLQFFRGDIPPPDVEALLLRFISPIRPGRKDSRKLTAKPSVSFTYRVA